MSESRILRSREVCARTGLSRVTLWRLERRGEFPGRRQLTANTVGWLEAEVEKWIVTRDPFGAAASDVATDEPLATRRR